MKERWAAVVMGEKSWQDQADLDYDITALAYSLGRYARRIGEADLAALEGEAWKRVKVIG